MPDRVPVLCMYDYEARDGNGTYAFSSGLMIEVESSFFILQAFEAKMRALQPLSWPRIVNWKLTSYLPQCRPHF